MSRLQIAVAESSLMVRSGLIYMLQRLSRFNIDIAEIGSEASLLDDLLELAPDIVIVNPVQFGAVSPSVIKGRCEIKVVALVSGLVNPSAMEGYDAVISIYDSVEAIESALMRIDEPKEQQEARGELSDREKEVVVCVAKGMSNKQIADELSLSTHTVISHRRNITNKLEIYSASGLTIYAIVNKLVDIESIPAK